MTTNPEVLRLARQCIVEALDCPNDEVWVDEFLRNVSADLIGITVLAIEKTTELAGNYQHVMAKRFLSPEYATGQPWSSHAERSACSMYGDDILRYDHLRQSVKDNSDAD